MRGCQGAVWISIHPMLRFIQYAVLRLQPLESFQYIPCYGLSTSTVTESSGSTYFNTSHVTVYHSIGNRATWSNIISIHPMLRFIFTIQFSCIRSNKISIHPMLRFIARRLIFFSEFQAFQYIPCYGLSNSACASKLDAFRFQYIPCYGLSCEKKDDCELQD